MKLSSVTFIVISMILSTMTYGSALESQTQCGPEALQLIAQDAGIQSTVEDIKRSAGTSQTGTTMLGLLDASQKLGLPVVPVEITLKEYRSVNAPMIAWVDSNHYVVVWASKWFGTRLIVQDPRGEKEVVNVSDFAKRWSGSALVYSERIRRDYDKRKVAQWATTHQGTHVVFDETVAFAGTVDKNETVTHTFTYKNTGMDTLRVYARSTCSCIDAFTTDSRVPPGKTGTIDVTFDTTGRSGHTQQSVDVRTNDPDQPWIKLTLAATVRSGVKVIPSRVWLDDVVYKGSKTFIISIIDPDNSGISVSDIMTPSSLSASIGEAFQDSVLGHVVPIDLTFQADMPPGYVEDSIVVIFDSGDSVRIPVEGRVVGPLLAYPPVAYYDNSGNESNLLREIVLATAESAGEMVDSSLIRVESHSTEITTAVVSGCNEYVILQVKLSGAHTDVISDTLQVYTKHSEIPLLSIPVFAPAATVR